MANPVTHFLVAAILVAIFRDFFTDKKKFPLHYVYIAGFAALLPDFDVLIYYFISSTVTLAEFHRTFTHTLFVPLLFLILGFIFYCFKSKGLGKYKLKLHLIFFVIAFGTFTHLILDYLLAGYIMPLYPFYNQALGLNLAYLFPGVTHNTIIAVIDAAFLILWVIYLEVKGKLRDFI